MTLLRNVASHAMTNQSLMMYHLAVHDITIGEVLREYKYLFRSIPGATTLAYHHIPTTENPVRVPPRRILGYYKQEVEQLIRDVTTRHHGGELQPADGT